MLIWSQTDRVFFTKFISLFLGTEERKNQPRDLSSHLKPFKVKRTEAATSSEISKCSSSTISATISEIVATPRRDIALRDRWTIALMDLDCSVEKQNGNSYI